MDKFTYTQVDDYPIENLKKNVFQKMLTEHPYQDLYNNHCKYFNFLEKPVITPDGVAMSHWWDIEAAKSEGKTTMSVIRVEGFSQEDLLQFICFSAFFCRVSRRVQYAIIMYIRNYLENTENGKQWRKRIVAKLSINNINHIIGYITGYGDSQVSLIQTAAKKGEKYLDEKKYTFEAIRKLAEEDGKIKGTDPTKEAIKEKHKKLRELKKQEHQDMVTAMWDTLEPFRPFGFHLFEGSNVIISKDEFYRFTPLYAKVENGVLYMGVVSEDNRYKIDIAFEEDLAFKDGNDYKKDATGRYNMYDHQQWIGDEEEKEDPVPARPAQEQPAQAQHFIQEPAADLESVKEDALKGLQSLGISKAKSKDALESLFQKVPFPYKVEDIIKEALRTFDKSTRYRVQAGKDSA